MLKNKKIIIITSIIAILLVCGIAILIITNKSKSNNNESKATSIGLTENEVKNIVIKNVNNRKIYVDDVEKIYNVSSISKKETVGEIEIWEMYLEYGKSSLSAPIGQSYAGRSFYGTYCFAYNTKTKKCFKYMFSSDEYSRLKGWSTQGHKDDSNYWID